MAKQTRKASAAESALNILLGFVIQFACLAFIFDAMGLTITWGENFIVGVFMTVVSFARSYTLRRFFEFLKHEGILP